MKQFKPKAAAGMSISPEAHREWADKEGKHSSMPIQGMGAAGESPKVLASRKGFDPGSGVKAGEAATVAKGKGGGNGKKPFPSVPSSGPKSGPMKMGAGK